MKSQFLTELLGQDDAEANQYWQEYLKLAIDSTQALENDRIYCRVKARITSNKLLK